VALLGEMRETNSALQERLSALGPQITPVLEQANHDLERVGTLIEDTHSVLNANEQNIHLMLLHLKETTRHLEALSEDLRAHPWKIIWKADGETDGNGSDEAAQHWQERKASPSGR
jgi:hypothetical protein